MHRSRSGLPVRRGKVPHAQEGRFRGGLPAKARVAVAFRDNRGKPSPVRPKLLDKDDQAAAKALAAFEKTAKTYPYPAEIEGERELLALAEGAVV